MLNPAAAAAAPLGATAAFALLLRALLLPLLPAATASTSATAAQAARRASSKLVGVAKVGPSAGHQLAGCEAGASEMQRRGASRQQDMESTYTARPLSPIKAPGCCCGSRRCNGNVTV